MDLISLVPCSPLVQLPASPHLVMRHLSCQEWICPHALQHAETNTHCNMVDMSNVSLDAMPSWLRGQDGASPDVGDAQVKFIDLVSSSLDIHHIHIYNHI